MAQMEEVPPRRRSAFSFNELRLPALVTVVLMALFASGSFWVHHEVKRMQQERFDRMSMLVARAIGEAFAPTEQALMGLTALVENSEFEPTAARWENQIRLVLPYVGAGVTGLGFAVRVRHDELDALEAAMRERGYPAATIERVGAAEHHYVVVNNAPLPLNADAIGKDIASGTTRREAAEAAARQARFELSRQILIVHGDEVVPGLLLFFPVYRGAGVPEPADRDERLVGWVYASVRPGMLFLETPDAAGGQVVVQIHQGSGTDAGTLLYASEPNASTAVSRSFTRTLPVTQYGQPWTLWVGSTPAFDRAGHTYLTGGVLYTGVVVSLLAGVLTWSLVSSRRRALALADQMTADLARTERDARRLALVASRTANSVLLADPEWRIEWVNEGFTRLSGYELEEVRGRRPAELFNGPGSQPEVQSAMAAADAQGVAFTGELLNYRKDGSTFWVEIEIQPLFDEQGRRAGYMALQLDITRRKQIESELAERMREIQRLALVASRTASSVAMMDPDGRINWVNESFTRLFGFTLDEVKGRRASEFLHGAATDPEVAQALTEAGQNNQLFKGEIVKYARDGRMIWLRLEVQPLFGDDGEKLGYLGLHVDITELKQQAAELLAAKEAAEQANLAKSQFLAMMSHEIRTPMNGVIGMSSLLLDSSLAPAQREYVETIRQSGDALLNIINDILDFSKVESGQLQLEQEVFTLPECVEGVLDLLSPRADERRIQLLYETARDVPIEVRGDETRLRQVLVNLVSNAIKFTREGEVVLTVRVEERRGPEQWIEFSVQDTGIGIPAEALSRLFQSFTQVDASTTRRFGGTGLGLAISKRLVDLMRGRMRVESKPGVGSTFVFSIPLPVVEPSPPSVAEVAPDSALRGRRLLVVEPHAVSRRILVALAARFEMTCDAVSSPEEALALVEGGSTYDFGLVEFSLEERVGPLLTHELRQRPVGANLPLVLLSTLGVREYVPEPGLYTAFLSKPVKPAQFYQTLERVLHRRGWAPVPIVTAPLPEGPLHPERILLAEDNVVNQKVALHMLARLGYRADIAANGADVLTAATTQPYDIILMDVQMPEMDGLESTRRLRRLPLRGRRPWVIALTANAMQGDRERCLAAGMDDYLSKPLKVDALAAALATARESRN
jgi:PAS domain S-box-containing protein